MILTQTGVSGLATAQPCLYQPTLVRKIELLHVLFYVITYQYYKVLPRFHIHKIPKIDRVRGRGGERIKLNLRSEIQGNPHFFHLLPI